MWVCVGVCANTYFCFWRCRFPVAKTFAMQHKQTEREVINCLGALLLSLKTFSARRMAGRTVLYPIQRIHHHHHNHCCNTSSRPASGFCPLLFFSSRPSYIYTYIFSFSSFLFSYYSLCTADIPYFCVTQPPHLPLGADDPVVFRNTVAAMTME